MRIVPALKNRYRAFKYILFQREEDRAGYVRSPFVRTAAETVRQIKRDDLTLMAAGVAYYAILSVFPLTLLLLGILRLFADSATARANLENFFSVYLPDSIGFVDQIADQDAGFSSLLGVLGLIGLLWSGTAMLSALNKAVNRAFGIHDDRPFYKARPRNVLLGIAVIAAFAASLFGSAAIESVSQFNVPVIGRQTWVQVFARFLPFGVTLATFVLIYKVLPNARTSWRNVLPAALFAAVLFDLAKAGFLLYLNRVASFEIYGGMALLVVLMVWSYYSAFVVLVGAEVVAVRRQMDTSTVDIGA